MMLKSSLSMLFATACICNSASAATNLTADSVQSRLLNKNIRSVSDIVPRVVGGTNAGPNDNPFQVGLMMRGNVDTLDFLCGGTLVDPKFVVTAAHCSDIVTANKVQVLVGARKLDSTGKRINVSKITVHPKWNRKTSDYDVAVWELSEPATGIPVASLATQDEKVGTKLLLTGWGNLKDGGGRPVDLQRLEVPVVDRKDCNDRNSYDGQITENMFCAGFNEGGKDACKGDSGGPLARGNKLVGISSWGTGCARPNLVGIYTRVSQPSIRDFILKSMRKSRHAVVSQTWENNTDRPGWDYKNIGLSQANPALCEAECGQDGVCKAWTYVKPGVQGPNARCFLKIATPAAKSDACCVSGVKQ